MNARFLVPLLSLAGLLVLRGIGLTLKPGEIPSPLIGKPRPSLAMPLNAARPRLRSRNENGTMQKAAHGVRKRSNVWTLSFVLGTTCTGTRLRM